MNTLRVGIKTHQMIIGIALVLMLLTFTTGARSAEEAGAAAYGFKPVGSIRGSRALHWLGNSYPGVAAYSKSIVGLCSDSNCLGNKQIRTGYAFGYNVQGSTYDNAVMHVYYRSPSGTTVSTYLSQITIPENSWYDFQVLYSNSAKRWEAWVSGIPRWNTSTNPGWTSGSYAVVGAESVSNPYFDVTGVVMNYKVGTGPWTLYDYSTELEVGACISRQTNYGFHAQVVC